MDLLATDLRWTNSCIVSRTGEIQAGGIIRSDARSPPSIVKLMIPD